MNRPQNVTLTALFDPTLDGTDYTGLYAAIVLKYNYAPTYASYISATLLDGFLKSMYADSVLRCKFWNADTNAEKMKAAYDAMYYNLATHESDLKRYADLADKKLTDTLIVETVKNEYGEDVTRKAYGEDVLQKSYGQTVISVANAIRNNTNTDYTSPFDVSTFAARGKTEQHTDAFTDTTTTGDHTDTDTRSQRTDTDTREDREDNVTRRAILELSARDYVELEKELIACNFYEEVSSYILGAACISVY